MSLFDDISYFFSTEKSRGGRKAAHLDRAERASRAMREQKSTDLLSGYGPLYGLGLLGYSDVFAQSASGALAVYRKSSAVSIPVNLIAKHIRMLEPVVITDGTLSQDSAVLELIRNPGPDWPRGLFLESLAINKLITGNCYVWGSGNINNLPLELAAINPAWVNVITSGGDGQVATSLVVSQGPYAGTYERRETGNIVRFVRDDAGPEILQIKDYNSQDSGMTAGESPLISVAPEIQQLISGNNHNTALLRNGGVLSLLFSLKGDLTPDQFKDAKSQIQTSYAGEFNAGTVGVISAEDATVSEFGKTPKDMDFEGLQKTAKRAVAQRYGIPGILVNDDAATFNNLDAAREMMFDNAVEPVAHRILQNLGDWLFFRDGISRGVLTFNRHAVPALRRRNVEETKLLREIYVLTDNELRKQIGEEPTDGGNEVLHPATLVPLGDPFALDNPKVLPTTPAKPKPATLRLIDD